MRALRAMRYGSIEDLEIQEVPDPVPGPHEVLIETRAASLNALDWRTAMGDPWFIRFFTGLWRPGKVPVMGADIAGIVKAVGPEVSRFRVGDAVFGEVGLRGHGGLSTYGVCSEDHVARLPDTLSFEEGACLGVAGSTALQGLRDHADVGPGEHVAVAGASGGVGHLAVQVAKALGAEVTAVTSTPKLEMVQKLGADHVLDRMEGDWLDRGPFDVIFEPAVHRPLRDYLRAVSEHGRFVLVGGDTRSMLQMLSGKRVFGADRWRSFTAEPHAADLDTLARLCADGLLRPVVAATYPLEQASAAIRRLYDGDVAGKLVVRPR